MIRLLMIAFFASSCFAVDPADSVFEVRTTGSDSNCGGFAVSKQGATGVDKTYPTPTTTTFTSTLSAVGTTTLTDSANGFTNTMLGNCINISGQGIYFVFTFTDSGHVVMDRALGTFSTTSGVLGGAFASLGEACLAASDNQANIIYLRSGSYTITTASTNTSGGTCARSGNSGVQAVGVRGYTSTRDDYGGSLPVLTLNAGVTGATMFVNGSGGGMMDLRYISMDGGSQTTSRGVGIDTSVIYRAKFANFTNSAVSATSGNIFLSTVTGCSTQPAIIAYGLYGNVASANTITAFSGMTVAVGNIAAGNTGASSDGFITTVTGAVLQANVAYANGRDGFQYNSNRHGTVMNNISEGNGRYGINGQTASDTLAYALNNATYNNTSGAFNGWAAGNQFNNVALSTSPFVNAAGGNFALNNSAGAGAAARAVGFPTTFPDGLTLNYRDIGAAQHQDTGGGSFVGVQ